MLLAEKLKRILDWQTEELGWEINSLSEGASSILINDIENLMGEKLPPELTDLYLTHNGESGGNKGIFLGHQFLSADEITKQIAFGLSLVKPEKRFLKDADKSKRLIDKIVNFYYSKSPKKGLFKKSWYKVEFSCGPGSYGGPYLYKRKETDRKNKKTLNIEFKEYSYLAPIIKELHKLEKDSYNWDELEFVMYADKSYEVQRVDYNFNEETPFTSTPIGAIKKMYFNPKWIPIFSDHGGNYIGIDMDPDIKGKKGQVIVFGRDEEDMFVLSDDTSSFLDLIIKKLTDRSIDFTQNLHLHDVLKEMITP